jgi:O-acetylhomoserine (thiol)-lyase
MAASKPPHFNTLSLHAVARPDPAKGVRRTPIYQTLSFIFPDADHAAPQPGMKGAEKICVF